MRLSPFNYLLKQADVTIPSEKRQARAWIRSQAIDKKFEARMVTRFKDSVKNLELAIAGKPIEDAIKERSPKPILEAFSNRVWVPLAKQVDPVDIEIQELFNSAIADLINDKGSLEVRRLLKDLLSVPGAPESFEFSFTIVNPETSKWLSKNIPDMIKIVDKTTRKAIQEGVRDIITEGVQEGLTVPQMARRIRESVGLTPHQLKSVRKRRARLKASGMKGERLDRSIAAYRRKKINERGRLIARTEISRAESFGQEEAWRQAEEEELLPKDVLQKWVASPFGEAVGGRTDDICLELHRSDPVPLGQPFKTKNFGEYMRPPDPHPACLPGNNRVESDDILAVSKRIYNGDVIVIRTAEGKEFSCTPNHPILTRGGWVPADGLDVGDHVISHTGREWVGPIINGDHKDVPPTIHEVADSFRRSLKMSSSEVPTTTEDFHGDGMDGQVAVVWANRFLGYRLYATKAKEILKSLLHFTRSSLSFLSGFRILTPLFQSSFASPRSLIGGRSPFLFFFNREGAHHENAGGLPTAAGNSTVNKPLLDDRSTDGKKLSERLLRLTGQISTDEIVNIDRRIFNGHVYNLQTSNGYYIAQGVVVHNCRCTRILVFPEE